MVRPQTRDKRASKAGSVGARGVVNPSLQRAEDIGDVLGPDGCRVRAADADMYHPDVAAAPHRAGLS